MSFIIALGSIFWSLWLKYDIWFKVLPSGHWKNFAVVRQFLSHVFGEPDCYVVGVPTRTILSRANKCVISLSHINYVNNPPIGTLFALFFPDRRIVCPRRLRQCWFWQSLITSFLNHWWYRFLSWIMTAVGLDVRYNCLYNLQVRHVGWCYMGDKEEPHPGHLTKNDKCCK